MVVRASAPAVLDTRPHGRDAGPRLARVDSDPDGELGRIDAVLAGDFVQMQRVRRRADERGCAELLHPGEPGWRILPAAGQHHRSEGERALEAFLESHGETERER